MSKSMEKRLAIQKGKEERKMCSDCRFCEPTKHQGIIRCTFHSRSSSNLPMDVYAYHHNGCDNFKIKE